MSLPVFAPSFQRALRTAREAGGDPDALVGALVRGNAEAQVGGFALIPDHDLFRAIAFRELGQPDYLYADNWASLADFEEQYAGRRSETYRKMRPEVQWIEKNRARIEAEASKWRMLFSFSASMKSGLELGDGLALAAFIRAADLEARRFDRVVGECPMVL